MKHLWQEFDSWRLVGIFLAEFHLEYTIKLNYMLKALNSSKLPSIWRFHPQKECHVDQISLRSKPWCCFRLERRSLLQVDLPGAFWNLASIVVLRLWTFSLKFNFFPLMSFTIFVSEFAFLLAPIADWLPSQVHNLNSKIEF